jgi:alpha-tubulin suppressor-like RCC1 family protein
LALCLGSSLSLLPQVASAAAPTITAITPTSLPVAPAAGGTVTVTGVGFRQYAPLSFTQISTGSATTLGVGADGRLYAWGANTGGQFGNGTTTASTLPVLVNATGPLAGKTISQVVSGRNHACALADGEAYCWGLNDYGQVGTGTLGVTSAPELTPVLVDTSNLPGGAKFKQLALGSTWSCGIATDDKTYCWGDNRDGQLGNNSTTDEYAPVPVSLPGGATFTQIAANTHDSVDTLIHTTCAVASDGKVYCWGAGPTVGTSSLVPVAVGGALAGKAATQIEIGRGFACAIASGQAYCWGRNERGELGDGTDIARLDPVAVLASGALAGKTVSQLSVGGFHTCVMASDAKPYCWGVGGNGQLGNNATTDSLVPVAVDITTSAMAGKTIKQISAGGNNACVIASDDKAYCWGQNNAGQLGDDTTIDSPVPYAVSGPSTNALLPATVTVGGTAATAITVVSNTQLTFTAPTTGAGVYPLNISYSNGNAGTGKLLYGTVAIPDPIVIDDPITGGDPKTAVACGTGMTCTIAWSPAIAPGGKFRSGTLYTAIVTVTADPGYTLDTLTGVTINGTFVPFTDNDGQVAHGSYKFLTPTAGPSDAAAAVPTLNPTTLVALTLLMLAGGMALTRRRA